MTKDIQLNLKDHDLLIRVDQKVDNLIESVRQLNDDMSKELARHDLRIEGLEKVHEELNPYELANAVKINSQWINDFKITWKVVIFISAIISSIVGFIIALVTLRTRLIQK